MVLNFYKYGYQVQCYSSYIWLKREDIVTLSSSKVLSTALLSGL